MTVPIGPASLVDIQVEFGGNSPTSLNEYYAGGPYVTNPAPTSIYQTGLVPPSGLISIGDFLGLVAGNQYAYYDNPGTYNFKVPSNVNTVYSGSQGGGGGGGGTGRGSGAEHTGAGAGGGSGYYANPGAIPVTPNETLQVIVGAGGGAGAAHYSRDPLGAGSGAAGGLSGILRSGNYLTQAIGGGAGTGGHEDTTVSGGSGYNYGGNGIPTNGADVHLLGGVGGAAPFSSYQAPGGVDDGTGGGSGQVGGGGGGGGASENNPQDGGSNGGPGGNGYVHITWGSTAQPPAQPATPPAPAPPPAPVPTPSPPPGCVTVDTIMFNGDVAKNFYVGRTIYATDPYSQFQSNTISDTIVYSKSEMQPCFRIVTESGAVLECSSTAPIPTRDNGLQVPQNLLGQLVATASKASISLDGTQFKWDEVTEIVELGSLEVQHISVDNQCFWASKDGEIFILHHNIKTE